MKKIILLFLLIILTWFSFQTKEAENKLPSLKTVNILPEQTRLLEWANEVALQEPLRLMQTRKNAYLTHAGILQWTNHQRAKFGLTELKENELLNEAAELKLEDMFDREYFAHVSPLGVGPADVVAESGFEFLLVAENLALGDFADDQALVQGWMDSPGHRDNILRKGLREIGVAVKKGIFAGRETWLAVQTFGTAHSVCHRPDEVLASEIENNNQLLQELNEETSDFKSILQQEFTRDVRDFNAAVAEHNLLVDEVNDLVLNTKILVAEYNTQAGIYNSCVQKVLSKQ